MKLDPKNLRYLTSEDFRVLTSVEMGSKNHEVVPTVLVSQIASLRAGGTHKILIDLSRKNLVARVQNTKYDGYRLTYGGYDYLALKTFSKRNTVVSVGSQIGIGKESVADDQDHQRVLKLHRLGRISFRSVKNTRDYLQKRKSASWLYMSRLAAAKEYSFMKALYDNGFPVPQPIDQNRHCIVMELIDAYPLRQVEEVGDPGKLYSDLMNLILKLASYGLIHGDFNEFNLLIKSDMSPVLIDFPQMISTNHPNAPYYFDRDVQCIRSYFQKRFRYQSRAFPNFKRDVKREFNLDVEVAASGFNKKMQRQLEEYMEDLKVFDEDGDEAELTDEDSEDEENDDVDDDADEENNTQTQNINDGGNEQEKLVEQLSSLSVKE